MYSIILQLAEQLIALISIYDISCSIF